MLIESLESRNVKVDDIIQSLGVKKVFVDGVRLLKSIEDAVISPCVKFAIPTFLPRQITAYNIGSLEYVSSKDEIKIIKQIDT